MNRNLWLAVVAAAALAGCGQERWEAHVVPVKPEVVGKFASLDQCKTQGNAALKAKNDTSSRIECRKNCLVDPRKTSRMICDEIAG